MMVEGIDEDVEVVEEEDAAEEEPEEVAAVIRATALQCELQPT